MKTGYVVSEREYKSFVKRLDTLVKKQQQILTATTKQLNQALEEVELLKIKFQNGDSSSPSNSTRRQSGKK